MTGVQTCALPILAALVFIGPKELPGAMRTVGRWVGQARAHARHFTAGIENMMRESELEEMEKRWREENERIMRDHPTPLPYAGTSEASSSLDLSGDKARSLRSSGEPAPAAVSIGSGEPAAPHSFASSDVEARQLPPPSLDEEPPLPLPEPDHHRRELP